MLDEALRRMRAGEVKTEAGYDGEYGTIRVFDEQERRALLAQRSFAFALAAPAPEEEPAAMTSDPVAVPEPPSQEAPPLPVALASSEGLNEDQRAVVEHAGGPLLVVAGPGTGKTRVIVERIAHLIEGGVSPRAITAISFTRKAAAELRERLCARLGSAGRAVGASTFHALGLELLRAFPAEAGLAAGFRVLDEAQRLALAQGVADRGLLPDPGPKLNAALELVSRAKAGQGMDPESPGLRAFAAAYEEALSAARRSTSTTWWGGRCACWRATAPRSPSRRSAASTCSSTSTRTSTWCRTGWCG